jgi:hypothetical protein
LKESSPLQKLPGDSGKADPYALLWLLPVISYAGPVLGLMLSKHLSDYYAIAVFALPLLGGIATLILAIEPTSQHGAAGKKIISRPAVAISLINLLVYPIILFVAYQ